MPDLKEKLPRVADAPFPVVIEGESGTGKQLITRAIHEDGSRRAAVFVLVNCAVLGDGPFDSSWSGTRRAPSPGAGPRNARGCWSCPLAGRVLLEEVAELTPRAGQAAARAPGRRNPKAPRVPRPAARSPGRGRHEPGARPQGGRGPLPQGRALPPQRRRAHGPAVQGARAGCRPTRRALLEGRRRGGRQPRDPGVRDGNRFCGRASGVTSMHGVRCGIRWSCARAVTAGVLRQKGAHVVPRSYPPWTGADSSASA